jgi:23S rRNA (guanosine2251-2'-O)-methyltransferase
MKEKGKWEREKFTAPRKGEPRKGETPKGETRKIDTRKAEMRTPSFKENPAQTQPAAPSSQHVYGVLPVLEALRAGARRIEKIFVAEGGHEKRLHELLELARGNRVPFQKVPRANLARYVEAGANHQGVIAFVASADYADAERLFEEIAGKEDALAVILDGVEDPRNLGAILRTVDCAGGDGVFIPERRAVGLTETVAKTSAGATEYVKIAKVTNISRLIDEMKARNIWTVGASAEAKMDYTDWDWTQRSALVLGSEGKGLHRLVAEKCDVLVKIPLQGKIESLNVSVAAGVILYEAVRQRREKAKTKEKKTKD